MNKELRKRILFFLCIAFGLLPFCSMGQGQPPPAAPALPVDKPDSTRPLVYTFAEQMPSFPGYEEYLVKHIIYPKKALEAGLQGKVVLRLKVMEDGHVADIEVLKSNYEALTEEAIRVIKGMPKWVPAKIKNKPVACYYVAMVKFVLPGNNGQQQAGPDTVVTILDIKEDPIYLMVDSIPSFPNYIEYLKQNVVYPKEATKNGTHGIVKLEVIIEKTGEVGEITVKHGQPDGLTEEAIRVIKGMPKWQPGIRNGKPVRTIINLSIHFD